MEERLLVCLTAVRKRFAMEDFLGTDDIFFLVKKGSFLVEWEGKSATVRESEGFLFRKNVLYHRHALSPLRLYLFRYQSHKPAFPCDHVIFQNRDRLRTTLSLLEELDSGLFKSDFTCRCHLFQDLIFQYSVENGVIQGSDPLIEQAITEIKNGLRGRANEKKLTDVSRRTGLSYVQFLRRFKAYTGMLPSDYITSLQIQKAKELLTNSDLRINVIANSCGFENGYYFSSFFKKHTGMSPSAFRTEFA